jgi:hypothetical protein
VARRKKRIGERRSGSAGASSQRGFRRQKFARSDHGEIAPAERMSAALAAFPTYFTVTVIFFETTGGLKGKCLASPSTN